MDDRDEADYQGGETTGFQSPARDYIEHVIDLLIANTAADPADGKVVVAVLQGSFRLATLERRQGSWLLRPSGAAASVPVSDDAEIWAIVAGLVREDV
jgi:hypothetical protein